MRILGVDPGKATGITVWDSETQEILYFEIDEWDPYTLVRAVERISQKCFIDHHVYEDFLPRWGQKFDITPIKLIGAMDTMRFDWHKVKPSEHKSLVKDVVLNKLIHDQGHLVGEGHSRDALRLTVYYSAAKLREQATLELIKGGSHGE